ncbi:MAG: histidine kinase dimerization/phospho-acceptor domain-containing protein [Thermomonas sp.]
MAEQDAGMFERLAHDLRGPLTPLRTAAFLLRRGDTGPEQQRELLEIIDRQTERLGCMLQEVADWQSAVHGRLQGRPELSELEILLAQASDELQPVDAIQLDLDDEIKPASIAGDAQRLVQMFASLMSYAQARAVDGKVRVSGCCVDSGVVVEIRYQPRENTLTNGEERIDFTRPELTPFDEGLGWRLMIANAIALAHAGALSMDGDRIDDQLAICVRLPMRASM